MGSRRSAGKRRVVLVLSRIYRDELKSQKDLERLIEAAKEDVARGAKIVKNSNDEIRRVRARLEDSKSTLSFFIATAKKLKKSLPKVE